MKRLSLTVLVIALCLSTIICQAQTTDPQAEIKLEKDKRTGEVKAIISYDIKTTLKSNAITFDFSGIDMQPGRLPEKPELMSQDISFEHGVYGVKVGMNTTKVFEILGAPTSEMALNQNDVLYSYGRNMWIVAQKNQIVSISSKNVWLSSNLTNLMEFDERPLNDWKINGVVSIGDTKQQLESLLDGKFTSPTTFEFISDDGIIIEVELIQDSFTEDKQWVVDNYNYGYLATSIEVDPSYIHGNVDSNDDLFELITNNAENMESTTIAQMPFVPIFIAYGGDGEKVCVYNESLAIIFKNDVLQKVKMQGSFFKKLVEKNEWSFGKLYSGQSSEAVAAIFEDNFFSLGDYWEIYTDNYKYDLYFSGGKNELILDELEFEVY